LTANERDVLRTLPDQLREALRGGSDDDPGLRRLFPPAYMDDAARNEEYERLVRADLMAGRLASLETMERTVDAARVDRDELEAWLSSINDLRLLLGSRMAITEDMTPADLARDDPRAPAFALYVFLSVLEEDVVAALAG
jgi:hypothetical protein